MNPVLILCRNNLSLTKRTVSSVRTQDIDTDILIIDNDSTDGTGTWCRDNGIPVATFRPQLGVSSGWNYGLRYFFEHLGFGYCLVLNNDVVLPKWFYRKLLSVSLGCGFVTGNETTGFDPTHSLEPEVLSPPVEHPDFSAFLMHRFVYEKVGPFDEDMKFYASDNDYHIRAHKIGIPLSNAAVPYYHERSSTLKNASAYERDLIEKQANVDREVLKQKWGVLPGTPEYAELFK